MSQNVVNSYRYVTETPTLITDGSSNWTAKFDLKGNSSADNGGGIIGGICANASTSDSVWADDAIGIGLANNGLYPAASSWYAELYYSYGGRTTPSQGGFIYSGGSTAYVFFLLEQSSTTVTVKAYPSDADRTNDTNQAGVTISMTSFIEMTDMSYAFFGDDRDTLHTFNGNADNFSVIQSGNVNWSDNFSDASKWDITVDQPTVNDAVADQGNIAYAKPETWSQKWARQGLTA